MSPSSDISERDASCEGPRRVKLTFVVAPELQNRTGVQLHVPTTRPRPNKVRAEAQVLRSERALRCESQSFVWGLRVRGGASH